MTQVFSSFLSHDTMSYRMKAWEVNDLAYSIVKRRDLAILREFSNITPTVNT